MEDLKCGGRCGERWGGVEYTDQQPRRSVYRYNPSVMGLPNRDGGDKKSVPVIPSHILEELVLVCSPFTVSGLRSGLDTLKFLTTTIICICQSFYKRKRHRVPDVWFDTPTIKEWRLGIRMRPTPYSENFKVFEPDTRKQEKTNSLTCETYRRITSYVKGSRVRKYVRVRIWESYRSGGMLYMCVRKWVVGYVHEWEYESLSKDRRRKSRQKTSVGIDSLSNCTSKSFMSDTRSLEVKTVS